MNRLNQEFHKLLKTPNLISVFSFFLITFLVFSYLNYGNSLYKPVEIHQKEFYKDVSGTITQKKYDWVVAENRRLDILSNSKLTSNDTPNSGVKKNILIQGAVFYWLEKEYNRILSHEDQFDKMLDTENEKAIYFKEIGDIRKSIKVESNIEILQGRRSTSYEYLDGIERFIMNQTQLIYIGIFLLYACYAYIKTDRNQSMTYILQSTKFAAFDTGVLKLVALIILSISSYLLFFLINLGFYSKLDLIKGLHLPAYQMKGFMTYLSNRKVIELLLIKFLSEAGMLSLGISFVYVFLNRFSKKSQVTLGLIVLAVAWFIINYTINHLNPRTLMWTVPISSLIFLSIPLTMELVFNVLERKNIYESVRRGS